MPRGKQYKNPVFADNTVKYDAAGEKRLNVIGRRITEARKLKGMSLVIFADYLERFGLHVSSKAVGKWETGDSIPNAYQLIALCTALEIEDSLTYFMGDYAPLLNDDGMRKLREYRDDLIASGRYASGSGEIVNFRDIPVSELTASAGTGQFLDEGRFEMVSFPENKIPRGADFGVYVLGNSMEPVYHDGQIVFVQKCERVEPGQVGIFIHDGEGFIKVYSEQAPDESIAEEFTDSYGTVHPQPVLKSYNRDYAPRVIRPTDQFEVVGRVL